MAPGLLINNTEESHCRDMQQGKRHSASSAAEKATQQARTYQATVEDCTDAEDNDCSPCRNTRSSPHPACQKASPVSNGHRRNSDPESASTSPGVTPTPAAEKAPAPSTPVIAPVKSVRFWDQVPDVPQRRSSPCRQTTLASSIPHASARTRRDPSPPAPEKTRGDRSKPLGVQPTTRLSDVFRGLASYLIDVYKPTHSLTLTPDKLYRFYSNYRIKKELIDFTCIFAPLTASEGMRRLEAMYLEMQCDYHLVQDNARGNKGRPCTPALTPEGFVQWMMVLVRAFPDEETERLVRIINDPSAPEALDRLPQHIPRDIFPRQPNRDARDVMERALRATLSLPPPGLASTPTSSPSSSTASSHLSLSHASWSAPSLKTAQSSPPPPLIHSDDRSKRELRHRSMRSWDEEPPVEVLRAKRSSPDRRVPRDDNRPSRHGKSRGGQDSPRRSKRCERDDRELDMNRHQRDHKWAIDSSEEARYRKRGGRASRA